MDLLEASGTIANGQSLTEGISLAGAVPTGLYVPSGWTTNAVSFEASYNGSDWFIVRDIDTPANEYVLSGVVASSYVPLKPANFSGVKFAKIRSGTSSAAAAQAGGDILVLSLRDLG